MSLAALEVEILDLHNRLTLRPTLETILAIGERLERARGFVPHGGWLPWLRRVGLAPRTAQTYLSAFRKAANAPNDSHNKQLSLSAFLRTIRQADKAARRAARERQAEEAIAAAPDPSVRIVHADCREFDWPHYDVVATDPPWLDTGAYRWLNEFARGRLLLVQAGVSQIRAVLQAIDLPYVWTLNVCYQAVETQPTIPPFTNSWRPVLVFGPVPAVRPFSDTYTVSTPVRKKLHPWQQPLEPWVYWLRHLTRPGQTVADPFAGSGTIGVAVRQIRGRSYVGTEIDEEHARTAKGRVEQETPA